MKESLAKEKSHKVCHIEVQWVFGGICCIDKSFFLEPVPSRDKETLVPLFKECIAPGTTIISECWKSYDCL